MLNDNNDINIVIKRNGPLLIKLKLNKKINCAIIDDFKRNGKNSGDLERCGLIDINDIFISINNINLENKPLSQILYIIKSELSTKSNQINLIFRKGDNNKNENNNDFLNDIKLINLIDIDEGLLREKWNSNILSKKYRNNQNRGIVWKILLRYLPLDSSIWGNYLNEKRNEYKEFINKFYLEEKKVDNIFNNDNDNNEINQPLYNVKLHDKDDINLLEEVNKDIHRTYKDIQFFNENCNDSSIDNHQIKMSRILFIFAKMNPKIKYVQGFNEICATLYYVFANDVYNNWNKYAEEDTYYCFTLLINEIRDLYISEKDGTIDGMIGNLEYVDKLLKRYDVNLFNMLQSMKLFTSYFAIRWISCIFCREFDLLDSIRIWDSYLADNNRKEFISFFATTMIMEKKDFLEHGNFASNLTLLQNYPPININILLNKSASLRRLYYPRTVVDNSINEEPKVQHEDEETIWKSIGDIYNAVVVPISEDVNRKLVSTAEVVMALIEKE
jgi:hypothetical protein